MKRIDTYTSILLFFIACQCAFAQTWPPETFTWYYTDSVVTPELKAKAKSGDPTALNDYAFSFWWSERTADEAVAKSRKWMKLAAKAGAPRAMLYYAAWQADNKKSSGYKSLLEESLDKIYNSNDADIICETAEYLRRPFLYFSQSDVGNMERFYARAAELGNKKAKRIMAEHHIFGGELKHDIIKGWMISPSNVKVDIDKGFRYLCESDTYDSGKFLGWAFHLCPLYNDSSRVVANRPYDVVRMLELAVGKSDETGERSIFLRINLGKLYYEHLHDFDKAFKVCMQIVDNRDEKTPRYILGEAMNILSKCYRHGRGVGQDERMAEYYLQEAYRYGNNSAEDLIKLLKKFE